MSGLERLPRIYYSLCMHIFSSLALFQRLEIEKNTKKQAESKLWRELRIGRVTASNFKACVSTNPVRPSISLLKRICYPAAYTISNVATR